MKETLREKQVAEAVDRMKVLHIIPDIMNQFKRDQKVFQSEARGIIYEVSEEAKPLIEKVERDGGLAYHVIKSFTDIGIFYSVLYVSKHEGEWELDRENIKHNVALTYGGCEGMMDCAEYGYIGIRSQFGGVVRTV